MATGRPADAVLASTDVAALAHVVAHLEQAPTAVEAAATAVLEIGHRRPFGDGSTAAAWLAAAHLLSFDGLRLRIGPVGAAGVLAAGDDLGVAEVADVLRVHSEGRRSGLGSDAAPAAARCAGPMARACCPVPPAGERWCGGTTTSPPPASGRPPPATSSWPAVRWSTGPTTAGPAMLVPA